jgi:uncharacterized protein with PhoU and TrkA domain
MDEIITSKHNENAAKYIKRRLHTLAASYEQIDSEQYRAKVVNRIQYRFTLFIKHCCVEVEEEIYRTQINKDSEDFKNNLLGF